MGSDSRELPFGLEKDEAEREENAAMRILSNSFDKITAIDSRIGNALVRALIIYAEMKKREVQQ